MTNPRKKSKNDEFLEKLRILIKLAKDDKSFEKRAKKWRISGKNYESLENYRKMTNPWKTSKDDEFLEKWRILRKPAKNDKSLEKRAKNDESLEN